MKRWIVAGAAGAAIVVGITAVGCAGEKTPVEHTSSPGSSVTSSPSSTSPPSGAANGYPTTYPPPDQAAVNIDGAQQIIAGSVVCTTVVGNLNIAVGEGASGMAVVISPDATVVHSVGLGNVNGVFLGFQQGISGGQATASKNGTTYTISGTATGVTAAIPPVMVSKPFEIKVTCP
ncbi:hypothetical protein BOO86_00520 [Mycobacterium sp. CBMA 234]|uniref:lipoprotein LpqH n=1 Tax=Mycolicibacterium sp. CBMA 234 TaxID=1918495 RepID=UPI0012DDE8DA|nr:lipoprotein LpqH [Mycolicibacterium sp. CBMA 234]MUL62930.1 hypothetical protein [Mycolicibacterium sp. CBMA 234]